MTSKSTIDRSIPVQLRMARTGLRTLACVAPEKAAAITSQLFCRPQKHTRPPREQAALADALPFQVRVGRRPVQAWRWDPKVAPTGRTVFLVHGWAGRGTQLAGFVEPLVAKGYTVVAWDGPGHGASAGDSSSLVELADTVYAVARALRSTPVGIIGHSMGAVAAGLAIAEGLACERAVWISPPASLIDFVHSFADIMGFSPRMQERLTQRMNRTFTVNMADYDVEEMRIPHGDRMLVIHDTDDKEVPIEHGKRVAAAISAAELIETQGLGHRRILRADDVIQRSVGWIAGIAPARA